MKAESFSDEFVALFTYAYENGVTDISFRGDPTGAASKQQGLIAAMSQARPSPRDGYQNVCLDI